MNSSDRKKGTKWQTSTEIYSINTEYTHCFFSCNISNFCNFLFLYRKRTYTIVPVQVPVTMIFLSSVQIYTTTKNEKTVWSTFFWPKKFNLKLFDGILWLISQIPQIFRKTILLLNSMRGWKCYNLTDLRTIQPKSLQLERFYDYYIYSLVNGDDVWLWNSTTFAKHAAFEQHHNHLIN